MANNDLLILGAAEVQAALDGDEQSVLDVVRAAYETHERGDTSLPHSGFLRFPDNEADRIISLPAYLGGDIGIAGVKWIASVPGNITRGIERASAVIVLNERATGRPFALLEGSLVSKQRTAASAALGAKVLRRGRPPDSIGFVGCGPINHEIARFLGAVWPDTGACSIFDLDPSRAADFGDRLREARPACSVDIAPDLESLLGASSIVSFATTAGQPHVTSLAACQPGTTVLHISLRDLAPEIILDQPGVLNVVDDYDHVCRASTSIHLAAQASGRDDFVHAPIGALLLGNVALPPLDDRIAVYSPFGLGVLDLAVAHRVVQKATERGVGITVPSFLP